MCGVIAGTGRIQARYLVALGCLSERRGTDSAGVAWQVRDKLRVMKIDQNPLVAFPVTLAPAIRHAARFRGVLIGHTRQATTGKVNAENAHPFLDEASAIAWAHNGHIVNYKDFGADLEVDSQALLEGIKAKDFKKYEGPIGLVWIENGKLHAFRKGNPVHRGYLRGAWYLASEARMLSQVGCHKIKELSEGRLYVWSGDKLESVTQIPFNKTYTYKKCTTYENDDGWKGWRTGARYDRDSGKWLYPDGTEERPVGYKFTPSQVLAPATQSDLAGIVDTASETADSDEELYDLAEKAQDKWRLCDECKLEPKMISADYCKSCYDKFINQGTGGHCA